ncbi:MAG TPA: M48 family metallopeptidase [Stellaceae bacterium]|nr:M48 family metallopeptidase [Stellaceae bacterium]
MARFEGWLADGRQAVRQKVAIDFTDEGLRLNRGETWPRASITRVERELRESAIVLASGDARLEVTDPDFAQALHEAIPELRQARRRTLRRASIATLLAVGIFGGIWWSLPLLAARIVPFIPPEAEEHLGDEALALPILGKQCVDREGQAALDALTQRLTAGMSLPYHLSVTVRSSHTVNAMAFPGGRVVLLEGVLKEAQSADEIAGILGHELTHVLKRHSTQALIANAGSLVLIDVVLGGGTGGALLYGLSTLSYSRDMEAEADRGALDLLARAHISSEGFADFFERLAAQGSDTPPYLASHPPSETRAALAHAPPSPRDLPALSASQWAALKNICKTVR